MYHIRIDTSNDNPVCRYLEQIATRILVSEETAKSGVHIHIVLETKTPERTIRHNIIKHGFKGNKSYSISAIRDLIKTLAYVVKDGNIVLVSYPEDVMKAAFAHDLVVKEDMVKKKTRNVMKNIISLLPKEALEHSNMQIYQDIIKETIIQYHIDNELLIRKFALQSYYDTILCKYQGSKSEYAKSLFFVKN
jgi:hypothetical protein